jgi:TM2 domain-containing membrane protein YozV
MKKKSKFLTFLLSFVPGLGQIYLGFTIRGIMFLSVFIGIPLFILFIAGAFSMHGLENLILFILPILWLASLVDSMILVDRLNFANTYNTNNVEANSVFSDSKAMEKQNKKLIAMLLSVIPGAGHLYLGLQRQGVELMAVFFLAFYLTDLLRVSIFIIVVPIIWFFSLFDVMHKVSETRPMTDDRIFTDAWFKSNAAIISEKSALRNKHKLLGYILIISGSVIFFNRIIYPMVEAYIHYRIRGNIQTGIVAFLLILGGLRLIIGSKEKDIIDGDDDSREIVNVEEV